MNFVEAIKRILSSANKAMTPQEIRGRIKTDFPEFYGTHHRPEMWEKGTIRIGIMPCWQGFIPPPELIRDFFYVIKILNP